MVCWLPRCTWRGGGREEGGGREGGGGAYNDIGLIKLSTCIHIPLTHKHTHCADTYCDVVDRVGSGIGVFSDVDGTTDHLRLRDGLDAAEGLTANEYP